MDYQIIIKIPFSAIDDPAARTKALEILDLTLGCGSKEARSRQLPGESKENVQLKLQKVYKTKPPEGVSL
jgi:hypothetical protein